MASFDQAPEPKSQRNFAEPSKGQFRGNGGGQYGGQNVGASQRGAYVPSAPRGAEQARVDAVVAQERKRYDDEQEYRREQAAPAQFRQQDWRSPPRKPAPAPARAPQEDWKQDIAEIPRGAEDPYAFGWRAPPRGAPSRGGVVVADRPQTPPIAAGADDTDDGGDDGSGDDGDDDDDLDGVPADHLRRMSQYLQKKADSKEASLAYKKAYRATVAAPAQRHYAGTNRWAPGDFP
jgi:hypothetical protein